MRRFHSVLLATATLALPLSAAAPAWAQVTVDPNALNALGGPVLPAPPPAARATPAHHPHPAHKRTHPHPGRKRPAAPATTAAPAPTPAPAPATVTPPAAATGPTEQEKGLGPSFTTIPTLPGAAPPLPAKPAPLPAPKATPAPAAKPAATPPGAALALPSGAPPAPPATTTAPASEASPPAPAMPAPAAPAPKPTAAPAKSSGSTLPAGADRMTLPYAGQDTALPEAESAMLRAFVQRYGPQAQYSVQAFASVPAGDDDPSTPRRIALDRARAVQSVLLGAGAASDHVRLIARGNAGGTPPDRVEVVAIPATPGHTAPSSAP